MQHRFASTTFLLTGGLLIWMTNFLVVYVVAALACARGFAHLQVAGMNIVPAVTTVTSLAAAAATVALVTIVRKRLRSSGSNDHVTFIAFVATATCFIALVALVMLALPPLLVGVCSRG